MGRHPVAVGTRAGVVLVGASAVFGVMLLASGHTTSNAYSAAPQLPGHATTAPSLPGASPAPTMAGDMPGMDHGSGGMPAGSPPMTESPWKPHDHSGSHSHSFGTPVAARDRPLAPVLGTFGGGAAVVMLSAGLLRRRDWARSQAKLSARAVRQAQK